MERSGEREPSFMFPGQKFRTLKCSLCKKKCWKIFIMQIDFFSRIFLSATKSVFISIRTDRDTILKHDLVEVWCKRTVEVEETCEKLSFLYETSDFRDESSTSLTRSDRSEFTTRKTICCQMTIRETTNEVMNTTQGDC